MISNINIKKMNGYENGKIYKVVDKNDNIIYIGSTKTSLKERWRKHYLNCDENKIILIENYPCQSREELLIYEQKFIDLYKEMGLLNKQKAYCSKEERKENKKEYAKNYKQTDKYREYRQSDQYKESQKKYEQSDKYKDYQKEYKQSDKMKETLKQYQKEYQKIKANCPHCNILMTKRYISRHTRLYCKNRPIDND